MLYYLEVYPKLANLDCVGLILCYLDQSDPVSKLFEKPGQNQKDQFDLIW